MERVAEATRNQVQRFRSPKKHGASVASVTVAFNGERILRDHLQSLKQQTAQIDEIIVVNNASTDATVRLLEDEYPEVTLLDMQQNCGVGGGLAAGLSHAALQKQYDWVWIFDQDSLPESQCLEKLLEGHSDLRSGNASTAVVAPICIHPQTGMMCHGLAWNGPRLIPTSPTPNQAATFLDSVISSGSLIHRQAIETAGLPRADFFMDFVDHEYCLRLRRHGFSIAVIHDGRLQHTLGEPAKHRFFGRTKYWSDHLPWREYYMTRNEVFTVWKYYPRGAIKCMLIYRLVRHALGVVLFGKKKWDCLVMMCRGFVDGAAGRLGITVQE